LHPPSGVDGSRAPGLQIEEDHAFQRRSWRVERAGTWLFIALLAAAAAGLLGSGPLSHGAAAVPGALRVEFQRFSQYQSPDTLRIHVEPGVTPGRELRLWLDRAYLEGVRLETMVPAPIRVETAADRLTFVFALSEPDVPFTVNVGLQPQRFGVTRARLGLEPADDGPRLTFRQLVYP
jgi:hypothetical protein